jgi:hypothetical protein
MIYRIEGPRLDGAPSSIEGGAVSGSSVVRTPAQMALAAARSDRFAAPNHIFRREEPVTQSPTTELMDHASMPVVPFAPDSIVPGRMEA